MASQLLSFMYLILRVWFMTSTQPRGSGSKLLIPGVAKQYAMIRGGVDGMCMVGQASRHLLPDSSSQSRVLKNEVER